MTLCGTPRALTYNKLGSLQGWGLDWKKADPLVRTILKPADIGLPSKLWEWSANDTMKAILAQQEAAKTFLIKEIYRFTTDKNERKELLNLLKNDPTANNWLHRHFREQYIKGHTFVRNQIVYQNAGYECKRISRSSVQLEIAGLEKGKRIKLKLKCRHVIKGQIRVIKNEFGKIEVHCTNIKEIKIPQSKPTKKIGIDKGYTEGFYTSEGAVIAPELGKLMTAKTERITKTNRNRYRLRNYALNTSPLVGVGLVPTLVRGVHPHNHDKNKSKNIIKNNLGYKVKSKRLSEEKATIQNFIRSDLRQNLTTSVDIYCEDLTQPIISYQSSVINYQLSP